jgi:signal transduction histidine kinase
VKLPPVVRSLRFRLSALTWALSFGVVILGLGAVYLTLLRQIRGIVDKVPVFAYNSAGEPVIVVTEVPTARSMIRAALEELILNRMVVAVLITLGALFVVSIVIGWLMAGRALRPLTKMTNVAQEIEATDLSRRIGLTEPDDELTRMAGTFDAMLDRLDRAFTSQKDFLAQTSHDLRTPLAVIRSNLDVTMSDPDAGLDDWKSTGEIALRASERMTRMIDDLLAAARLEVRAPTLVTVDLAGIARQVAEEAAARVLEQGSSVAVSAGGALVAADRVALLRAVGNLIDNALRLSPPESAFQIGSGHIDGWGYLLIADRGPGIHRDVLRGDRPVKGLGLTIVREIVRLHRGELDVAARPGGGSVIAIWIPLSASEPVDRPPMTALPAV